MDAVSLADIGPLAVLAIGQGLKLGSNLLSAHSARKRHEKIVAQQLAALRPAEERLQQGQLGPSQSEGSLLQAITQRTLMNLAQRGVLQGSGAASEVAGAIAPVEQQRQQHLDELSFRIAAIKNSIYGSGADVPGMEDAFAQSLGSAGGTATYLGGRQLGQQTGGGNAMSKPVEGVDLNTIRPLDPTGFDPNDPLNKAVAARATSRSKVRRG